MWARGKVAARRFEKGYFLCTFSMLLAETQCGGPWSGLLTSAARLPALTHLAGCLERSDHSSPVPTSPVTEV